MSTDIRKCISLGPAGFIYPGSPNDYRNVRPFFSETNTKWVRLYVDWPTAQPTQSGADPNKGNTNETLMQQLDAQIAQANADGVAVILVTYRYPTWTNPQTRNQYGAPPTGPEFAFPDDRSTQSPYGNWIASLIIRYGNTARSPHINVLEVVNEPNVQGHPQRNSQGQTVSPCYASQMFSTAQAANAFLGNGILLAGPAAADARPGNPIGAPDYDNWTQSFMAALPDGFDSTHWVYTHHNYIDTEQDVTATSSARVRDIVVAATNSNGSGSKWFGAREGASNGPLFFLTEGGARLPQVNNDRNLQNTRLTAAFNRLYNDNSGGGRGIGMFANYLVYGTGSGDDAALLEPLSNPAVRRPSFYGWTQVSPGRY